MKNIRYICEAALVWVLFAIFRAMPAKKASAIGGWIGRTLGPHLGASRKARENIRLALPEKTAAEQAQILFEMWDNLGRVMAEYPHLKSLVVDHTDVDGEDLLAPYRESNTAVIFIGAHAGNWELLHAYFNLRTRWPMACVYREPNNPYIARMLERCRNPDKGGKFIAKSQRGARDLVMAVKNGERIGILIDQKYNQGIPVPFFGRPAMTSSAFVMLSKKYNCPIVPLHVERTGPCRFRLTFEPPLNIDGLDEAQAVAAAHTILEDWVRKRPGQWLWLHRRWNSRALKNLTS